MLTLKSSPRITSVSAAPMPRDHLRIRALAALLAGCCSLLPALGAAQEAPDLTGPAIKLGETSLYPEIRVDYQSNDNAFLTASDEVDAAGVIVSPRLNWVADRRLLRLTAFYTGRYAAFDEDALDFADHDLGFNVDASFTKRKRLAAGIRIGLSHEELGTDQTRGVTDTVDEPIMYSDVKVFGNYTYGARNARGNLIFGLEYRNYDYSNLKSLTAGRGFTRVMPSAAFSYRLSPDTRLVTELRFASLAYENDDLDRNDISFLAGVSLSETGKTGGKASLGVTQSQYADSSRDDFTTAIAEVGLFYLPRTYSRLSLDLVREIDDTSTSLAILGAGQNTRDTARLTWDHDWSERFNSIAFVEAGDVTRNCPETDETTSDVGLELNLAVRRWLQVGVSAQQSSRSNGTCPDAGSNSDDLDYDRQIFGIHVRGRL